VRDGKNEKNGKNGKNGWMGWKDNGYQWNFLSGQCLSINVPRLLVIARLFDYSFRGENECRMGMISEGAV